MVLAGKKHSVLLVQTTVTGSTVEPNKAQVRYWKGMYSMMRQVNADIRVGDGLRLYVKDAKGKKKLGGRAERPVPFLDRPTWTFDLQF